jgi:hypothetical protein
MNYWPLEQRIVAHLLEKFPRILRDQKVHYRILNSLSLIPIQYKINPIHIFHIHYDVTPCSLRLQQTRCLNFQD